MQLSGREAWIEHHGQRQRHITMVNSTIGLGRQQSTHKGIERHGIYLMDKRQQQSTK
jgi:hypothetical protein